MKITEAIQKSKKNCTWNITPHSPTSVLVRFMTNDQKEDETELDLYEENKEEELSDLWSSLAKEMESSKNQVIYIEAYGYII